jgi:hypothetical protein
LASDSPLGRACPVHRQALCAAAYTLVPAGAGVIRARSHASPRQLACFADNADRPVPGQPRYAAIRLLFASRRSQLSDAAGQPGEPAASSCPLGCTRANADTQGNEQGLRTVLARVARSPGNPLISPAWLQPWAGSCPPSRAWRLARHLDHPALINSPAMTSTITAISTFVPAFPTSLAISSPRKYEIPT